MTTDTLSTLDNDNDAHPQEPNQQPEQHPEEATHRQKVDQHPEEPTQKQKVDQQSAEPTQQPKEIEPRLSGLLPVGIFLILFIGSGVILQDFYAMPAIVAFLCALVVAIMQNPKRSISEKIDSIARSMGESNVMIMCLVFVLAGAFTGAVTAAGGVDSTVNFALSILPTSIVLPGLFVIACFISLSMGTSVGTIAALAPIAVGIAEKTGLYGPLCMGAIVGGAMFGDNLSMISDTTIAATRTQGCRMDDKFKENFLIALPAAVVTFALFAIIGMGSTYTLNQDLPFNLLQVLPYIVVLFAALGGMNVFMVLILGTILSCGIGIYLGTIDSTSVFTVIAQGPDGSGGIMAMYDITVISMICAGIIGLVKDNGGIAFVLDLINKRVKSDKGAQFGIATLASAVDISTANNTVAIVIAGPIVKDISEAHNISPRRAASLIDIFTSVWQGIIPYGAQLLYASAGAAAAGMLMSPFQIIPYLFYPYLLALSALAFIVLTPKGKIAADAEKAKSQAL